MYSRERRITAWKVSVFGVFLVRFFSAFGLNTERYELEKLQIRGLITHWITHNLIVITMIAILYELFLLLQVLEQQSKTHVCLEWPENNSRVLFMHNQKNNFDSARFFGMVPPRYQPSENISASGFFGSALIICQYRTLSGQTEFLLTLSVSSKVTKVIFDYYL